MPMKTGQMATLAALSVSNLLLSFLFQWYVVTFLGSGWQTDALFAAMVVPNLVLAVVSSSLTHVLVPVLSTRHGKAFEEDAWMYFYLVGSFFIVASILLVLFDGIWLPLLLPGFSNEELKLTIDIFEIQVFSIVGASLVAVLEAASHAKLKFYNVEIIKNIVGMIAFLALALTIDEHGIYAAALIFALRPILSVFLLLRHLGKLTHPKIQWEEIKAVWHKLKYLIAGTTYYKTDPLLDRFLLSMATTGSITLYHMVQQIYSAGSAIINRAVAAPMVPVLARHAAAEDWKTFRSDYLKRFILISTFSLCILVLIYFVGEFFLGILFHHGNFDENSISKMWTLMLALSGIFVAGSAGQILSSSYYAYGNTKTPTHIGILGYTLGIVLKFAGFYYYSVTGVAIAASAYYVFNAIFLYIFLEKQIGKKIAAMEEPT